MRRRSNINHFEVADACRRTPGEWLPVGEYGSTQSADGVAWYIETAAAARSARSAYEPAGSFEARWTLTEFGAHVEARYVGLTADAAWNDAIAALIGEAA